MRLNCLNLIRIQRAVCVLVYASVGFKQCKLDWIKPRVVLELLISQTICFPFHLRHFKHAAEALIRSALTQQLSRKESLVHFIFINKKKSRTVQYHKAIFLFVLDHHDAFYQRESLFVFCQLSLYVHGCSNFILPSSIQPIFTIQHCAVTLYKQHYAEWLLKLL